MSTDSEISVSILLAGGPGVGKSSIARRLLVNKFSNVYTPTVGVDLLCTPPSSRSGALMQLWDPSHLELHGVWPGSMRGAHAQAVLLVCDPARPETLQEADEWLLRARAELDLATGDAWLLAHRYDRRVAGLPLGPHQLDTYCARRGLLGWRYTTARHGRSVHETFEQILEAMALGLPNEAPASPPRAQPPASPSPSTPAAARLRMVAADLRAASAALDASVASPLQAAAEAAAEAAAAVCPGTSTDWEDGLATEWEECARLSRALRGGEVS